VWKGEGVAGGGEQEAAEIESFSVVPAFKGNVMAGKVIITELHT